jgi:hypothetical protein
MVMRLGAGCPRSRTQKQSSWNAKSSEYLICGIEYQRSYATFQAITCRHSNTPLALHQLSRPLSASSLSSLHFLFNVRILMASHPHCYHCASVSICMLAGSYISLHSWYIGHVRASGCTSGGSYSLMFKYLRKPFLHGVIKSQAKNWDL